MIQQKVDRILIRAMITAVLIAAGISPFRGIDDLSARDSATERSPGASASPETHPATAAGPTPAAEPMPRRLAFRLVGPRRFRSGGSGV